MRAASLHDTGGTWRPVKVPFVGAGAGASASSPANVWVSGYLPDDDSAGGATATHNPWITRYEPSAGMDDLRSAAPRDPPGRQPLILGRRPHVRNWAGLASPGAPGIR